MITGRAVGYVRYKHQDLVGGVQLDPPPEALRAYIAAEGVTIRWAYSSELAPEADPHVGMPLEPGLPQEFDTDLQYLYLWAGAQDAVAHVYYFRSA